MHARGQEVLDSLLALQWTLTIKATRLRHQTVD